jgi:energy-coupling factor transporter ATP-binding protein EcfA2
VALDARDATAATEVRALIGDRLAAFAGHSGVGKSTLVNTICGAGTQLTGVVNEVIGRGRHTTTAARLLECHDGAAIIDTPGIRGFALTGLDEHELGQAFPEIAARGARLPLHRLPARRGARLRRRRPQLGASAGQLPEAARRAAVRRPLTRPPPAGPSEARGPTRLRRPRGGLPVAARRRTGRRRGSRRAGSAR